jgi:thymidine phosphorylase
MSKKIVESPEALVLDVKFGKGAFCQTMEIAKILSKRMVNRVFFG